LIYLNLVFWLVFFLKKGKVYILLRFNVIIKVYFRKGVGNMGELPVAAVDRIIRKSSGLRVSESAAKVLAEHLEEVGMKIAQEAALYSKHAGRKTVVDDDIRLVLKK
jgi:DNA-binding protein